jgi:hypothetical protein
MIPWGCTTTVERHAATLERRHTGTQIKQEQMHNNLLIYKVDIKIPPQLQAEEGVELRLVIDLIFNKLALDVTIYPLV